MRRFVRAFQSYFPALLEAKAWAQRRYRLTCKRPFEPDFEVLEGFLVRPSEVLIDAGANRGQSIDAIKMFLPNIMLHAFEPNPLLAQRLVRQFSTSHALTLHQFGLGDMDTTGTLYVPFYRGFMYDGLASFDRNEASGWLSNETLAGFDPLHLKLRETTCSVRRLDDFGFSVAFLKLDVQGFERPLLEGGKATLEASKPLILMERSPDAEAYLTGLGWQHAAWSQNVLRRGSHGHTNSIWFHPARPDRVAHLKIE